MFYFKEIFFRILYFIFLYILVLIIFLHYSDTIFTLFFFCISKKNHLFETSFIFTSPLELIDFYFNINFIFSILMTMPFFIFQVILFLNSGLKIIELKKIKIFFFNFIIFYYLLNLIFCFCIAPYLWWFIELTGAGLLLLSPINIEYEPAFLSYIHFLYSFYYYIFFFLFIFSFFNNFFLYQNIIFLISLFFTLYFFVYDFNIFSIFLLFFLSIFFFIIFKFLNLFKLLNINCFKFFI